jgi:hypothetical protein
LPIQFKAMRSVLFLFLMFIPFVMTSQIKLGQGIPRGGAGSANDSLGAQLSTTNITPVAPIDWYKIISVSRDSIAVDTTLTIQKEYKSNYLRKDLFGLLPLPNEGHTYNQLDFGLTKFNPYPEMGFKGKHFAFVEADEVNYYHVPTPMTDLHYKSVMEQGQILDAFITLNTSEKLNFSVGYKGIRSVGKYINSLSSNGVFRMTTSYKSEGNRYIGNYHITAQDFENGVNGGIVNIADFESGLDPFTERARLDVYFRDANSFLEGKRAFADHIFRVNKEKSQNNLAISHRFTYENKEFIFNQTQPNDRLGSAYIIRDIHDKTEYNKLYNRLGAVYQNESLGDFMFFVDDFRHNYHYNRITINQNNIIVPDKISETINTVGGEYTYYKNKWKGVFMYFRSLSDDNLSNLDVSARYTINQENKLNFRFQNINKLPDLNYNLYQSNYVGYNWFNNFKNQKINNIEVEADLKWFSASAQLSNINDYLYFSNDATNPDQLITTPKQYDKSISYVGVKLAKEFRVGKFALDNTVLYQQVAQDADILNVPQLVTRNTLYYSDFVFKKAMYIQTGFSLNYFTKCYANEYNGVIGEFFVQNQREIGDFPVLDFFINAKVSTAQIYLKAEHFNSSFTGYNFYATPNQPYRDFIIRFGILWNFFS